LVLVGDASADHKHIHDDSGPDFVPTYHRIDNVGELRIDEVVTTDKRLVKLPGPGGSIDVIPDMIVGRLLGTPASYGRCWRKRSYGRRDRRISGETDDHRRDVFGESEASFGEPFCYRARLPERPGGLRRRSRVRCRRATTWSVSTHDYTKLTVPPP
jgi:hypothetical protein